MKKMLAALLAAVMTLCFAAALAEDTGLEDLKAKGTFVMGFDEEYPPMGFVDENGEYVGFDIDLAKEVTSRLGVELVLQPIAWDSKELELSGKNIDCIWSGLTITPEDVYKRQYPSSATTRISVWLISIRQPVRIGRLSSCAMANSVRPTKMCIRDRSSSPQ